MQQNVVCKITDLFGKLRSESPFLTFFSLVLMSFHIISHVGIIMLREKCVILTQILWCCSIFPGLHTIFYRLNLCLLQRVHGGPMYHISVLFFFSFFSGVFAFFNSLKCFQMGRQKTLEERIKDSGRV